MKHLKSAWNHMRRTPYQSLAGIIITSLTFFVVIFITVLAIFSTSLLGYYEGQPQITVYFDDTIIESDIKLLKSDLEKSVDVESVKYISKSGALKIYQTDHKDEPLLLEMVTEDILPASLEIRASNISQLDKLAAEMKKEPGVEDIVYQKIFIDKLVAWTGSIRALGAILLTVLAIETILVILTIVGMRIVLKRKEIKILQLMGASPGYIRAPIIIEGIIYGILGTFVGWILNICLLYYQKPFLSSLLNGINELPLPYYTQINIWPYSPLLITGVLAVSLLLGLILGITGSLFAVHRYLK